MTTALSLEDYLQFQQGLVTRRQLSDAGADHALEAGLIEHAIGGVYDLTVDDDIVYTRPGRMMSGNDMGYLAPLIVATRDVPHGVVTPFIWEAALVIQDVGVLDLPTDSGADVAVPLAYAHQARDLALPDQLTVHPIALNDSEWFYFEGIPVQRTDLAIKHLADTPGMEPQWLEAAVTDAFCDELASMQQLADAIDRYARFDHPEPMTGEQLVARWTENAKVLF